MADNLCVGRCLLQSGEQVLARDSLSIINRQNIFTPQIKTQLKTKIEYNKAKSQYIINLKNNGG
ncbi:hypothetical protein ONJ95_25790, partial [Salmonella enterica subsp. enterica serovar Virginia]|nr:hypothetical protein [Salmonella enterica subsp. enterica serovar Virginia]